MLEIRQWDPEAAEVRAVDCDGMTFEGYAARFNSPSEWMGFTEYIAPGAFTRTLKARNEIKAFVNHDTNLVLGSTRAGTLKLQQDDKGLLAQITLPETTYGRDLAVSVARGDVSGMSFGFNVPQGGDTWSEDGLTRTLNEIALAEVSPVTGFPAYASTSASVRSLPLLAKRCGEDAGMLEIAVEALMMGDNLNADAAALLRSVIDKMSAPEDPEVEISVDSVPLSILVKQLDLLAKSMGPGA